MDENTHKVRTPSLPTYVEVDVILNVCNGIPKATVRSMLKSIEEQMGTPKNPIDWSDPDHWISERLTGKEAELAQRIWEESKHTVNPRYIYGAYFFINTYELLITGNVGIYLLSDRGKAFLARDAKTIRELDDKEGLLELLTILATKEQVKRGDLLEEWGNFLHQYSLFGSVSTIQDTLRRCVRNLVERGLVTRDGNAYHISKDGLEYAKHVAKKELDPRREVQLAITDYNTKTREALRKRLSTMPPYRFERLVGDLLEAMGYEDVTVTRESGDKGVDVVATVQFGITTITEVVQVKRHRENIGRPVLDQLRGALPYFKAIRGTLITVGSFSKECIEVALYPGAAPIGLIDGNKLLDLLIEHEIGIKKHTISLNEVDESYFTETTEVEEVAQTLSEDATSTV